MKILGIIPARFGSSRLEGKPLADINGKPMIQWVYERAQEALTDVVVATDDERIMAAVAKFGGKAVMTGAHHNSGTNRCLEAFEVYNAENNINPEVIINIQGDEPLLEPELLQTLASCFDDKSVEMATLTSAVTSNEDLLGDSTVFLTMDKNQDALYFSRFPIPHARGVKKEDWLNHHKYWRHIGLYAFTPTALKHFAEMPGSSLEQAEALEQLRWLEDGKKLRVAKTDHSGISVDTPADLEKVRRIVSEENL
ncbi:3-deoxy-manno-octulosonate cytidylyltransferase [Owenweeksia hongkongensis]|uniref:3-deoxy-manno-octulosonate cytidylyltransferase n=1 Tax=Owenweeksia hongkongensis TaxID=253245 RepID=UPI003A8D2503